MDATRLDQLIADTLVEDYGWDEERAESAVDAWRRLGSPNNDGKVADIAERIHNTSPDAD